MSRRVQQDSAEQRMMIDLVKSIAFENLWNMTGSSSEINRQQVLECLAKSFGKEYAEIQRTHDRICQLISLMPVKLDIAVSFGKVDAEKSYLGDLMEKIGVYCQVQVANSENEPSGHEDRGLESKRRSNSLVNIALQSNEIGVSDNDDSDRESVASEDALTTTLIGRFSLGAKKVKEVTTPTQPKSIPAIEISPPDGLFLAEPLRPRSGSSVQDGLNKSLPADCNSFLCTDSLHEAPLNKESHIRKKSKRSSKLPTKRTGTAKKRGGEFQNPKVTFEGVSCNKETEVIVSIWFENASPTHSIAALVASTRPAATAQRARTTIEPSASTGPAKWLRSFIKPDRVQEVNNSCLGMAKLTLQSGEKWTVLSKPVEKTAGGNEEDCCKTPNTLSVSKQVRRRNGNESLSIGFKVQLQLHLSLHQVKFSERTKGDFDKWLQRYFEIAKAFYRHSLVENAGDAAGTLSKEMCYILDLYKTHKGIPDIAAEMLDLAAVMSLRVSTTDQQIFVDVNGEDTLNHAVASLCHSLNKSFAELEVGNSRKQHLFRKNAEDQILQQCKSEFIAKVLPDFVRATIKFTASSLELRVFPPGEMAENHFVQRFGIVSNVLGLNLVDEGEKGRLEDEFLETFNQILRRDASEWFDRKMTPNTAQTPVGKGHSLNAAIRLASINIDSTSQLDFKFERLTEAIQEAVTYCTQSHGAVTQLQQCGVNFSDGAISVIDKIALPYVQEVLQCLDDYRRQYAKYVNNLTVTAKLSFKLYQSVIAFNEQIRAHYPMPSADSKLLSNNDKLFHPFVSYWMFAFRHLALTRVQKSATSDEMNEQVNERIFISWSAIEISGMIVSDIINECRNIGASDSTQRDFVNTELEAILLAVLDEYTQAIIHQAYNYPKVDKQNSSEQEETEESEEIAVLKIGERLMRAINNIDHVADNICQNCPENVRLLQECEQRITQCKNTQVRKYFKQLEDVWRPWFGQFFINTVVSLGDDIIATTKDYLECINKNLREDDAFFSVNLFWATLCRLVLEHLLPTLEQERDYWFYLRTLNFVRALKGEFLATQTRNMHDAEKALVENEDFRKVADKLQELAKNDHDLVYSYVLQMTNWGDRRAQQKPGSEPTREGDMDILIGKVVEDGLVIAAVHDIRSAFDRNANLYVKISVKPDFANDEMEVTISKDMTDYRTVSFYEFTGLTSSQLNDSSRPTMLVIEVWRKNITCDSYIGELVIPLVSISSSISRDHLLSSPLSQKSFYQPRRIPELLRIMNSRKKTSEPINLFLRWRYDLLMCIDAECLARNPVGQNETAEYDLMRRDSALVKTVRQVAPVMEPVIQATKSRLKHMELFVAGYTRSFTPNCFVQKPMPLND